MERQPEFNQEAKKASIENKSNRPFSINEIKYNPFYLYALNFPINHIRMPQYSKWVIDQGGQPTIC